jgi:hypothetical protein
MDDDLPPLESDFETDIESEVDIMLTPTSSTTSLTTGEDFSALFLCVYCHCSGYR